MEIYINNQKISPKDVVTVDFRDEIKILKYILSDVELDFSSINQVKGDKTIIEKAFKDQKVESLK